MSIYALKNRTRPVGRPPSAACRTGRRGSAAWLLLGENVDDRRELRIARGEDEEECGEHEEVVFPLSFLSFPAGVESDTSEEKEGKKAKEA